MFLRKFAKLFKKEKKTIQKKKKLKHEGVSIDQNHIEYVRSGDFEIFRYEEVNSGNFIEEYMNSLSARTVLFKLLIFY